MAGIPEPVVGHEASSVYGDAPMHADYVDVTIRQTADRFSSEVVELMRFRAFVPEDGSFDPSEVTDAIRAFLLENGGAAFSVEERRTWIDAGAAGSNVEFVVELLGSGAVGLAMTVIYDFAKARFKNDDAWRLEQYAAAADADLRDELLGDLERHMGLARGSVEVVEFERTSARAHLVVRHVETGKRYGLRRFANGDLQVRSE